MSGEIVLGIILAHFVGDYIIQNHWMAVRKLESWPVALVHGFSYTIPYIFVTQSIPALLVIALTHALIDRYRLARYVVWARNQLAPAKWRPSLDSATGSPESAPPFLAVWLMILSLIHI